MDPAKLKSYVDKESHNPFAGMPKMPKGNPDGDDYDDMDSDGESKSPMERGEELLSSMGDFGSDLKEVADVVGEKAKEVEESEGMSIEAAPSEDAKVMVMESVEDLPEHVSEGMKEHLTDKSDEDMKAVATALCEQEGVPCGMETMAGYLKCAGECAHEMNPADSEDADEGDDNPGDEMDDDESAEM